MSEMERQESETHLEPLEREWRSVPERRSLPAQFKDLVASKRLLTIFIHIFYAIPPSWPRGMRIPNFSMVPSIFVVVLIWMAFGMEMRIIKVLRNQGHADSQHPPIGSVLLVIFLVLSSALSFTIMITYFFNPCNRFHLSGESSKLIPGFEFAPLGEQQDVQLKKIDWLVVNLFLAFAITGLGVALYNALQVNIFFSFTDLHKFTTQIGDVQGGLYYGALAVLNWAHCSSILACGAFYIVCRSISRHVDFNEDLLMAHPTDLNSAKKIHECLLNYAEKISKSLTPWFAIHIALFGFIILLTLLDLMNTIQFLPKGQDVSKIWLSEVTASWLVSIQSTFPFVSTSLVTRRFEQMYEKLNRGSSNLMSSQELDAFLNYCTRCKSGFQVLRVRITTGHAAMSITSAFIGFFRFYRELSEGWMVNMNNS